MKNKDKQKLLQKIKDDCPGHKPLIRKNGTTSICEECNKYICEECGMCIKELK